MPQPQPFMREKSLWIIISLLALALLLVIFNQLRQDQNLKELNEQVGAGMLAPVQTAPSARVPTQASSSSPTPSLASSTMVAVPTADALRIELERSRFGSLTSPDAKWRLDHQQVQETQDGGRVMITHQLILRGLLGQTDRLVYTAKEYRTGSFEAVPGQAFTSDWEAVGWSADGTKVYYVSRDQSEGLGGAYPDFEGGFRSLNQVVVETGAQKKILEAQGQTLFHGIRDVLPQRNLLITSDFTQDVVRVYVSDLEGKNRRQIFQGQRNQDISGATLNGDGSRIAIVTHEGYDDGQGGVGSYLYRVYGYDLTRKVAITLPLITEQTGALETFRSYGEAEWLSLTRFSFMESGVLHEFGTR